MFDSMPVKQPQTAGRYASAQKSAPTRRAAAVPADEERVFDILAVWDDDVAALREQIDAVSSWGPYEAFECIPLFEGKDGRQRVLCRFMYHGAAPDLFSTDSRAQFKYALLNCLQQITEWEDVAGQAHIPATTA